MTFRGLVALGTIIGLLAGCGSDKTRPDLTKGLVKQLAGKLTGKDETPTTPSADQIRAAVTPEARAQFGNQPLMLASSTDKPVNSILVLASQNGDVRTYFTPDSISLSLRNGIVIASRGLGADLMRADVSQVMARIQDGSGVATRDHFYLDGENQTYRRRFTCTYAKVGAEVVESCSGADASFENRYALNSKGEIAVSVQWVSPQIGSFRLEDLG